MKRRIRQGGFTALEVMLVTSMMMTVLATVTVGVRAGNNANEELRRKSVLTAMSSDLMERLFAINFGQVTDPPATPEQLSELFDDDDFLGNVTLSSLRVNPGEEGFRFQFANFPYNGIWEVQVTSDVNGDGDLARHARRSPGPVPRQLVLRRHFDSRIHSHLLLSLIEARMIFSLKTNGMRLSLEPPNVVQP